MNRLQWPAFILLSMFLVYRGILPAIEGVSTDFPNYYTSARLLLEGKDMRQLYDDHWFQNQIYSLGMHQEGKFSPYPPVTAFVMLPLAILSPDNSLRAWTVINLLLLVLEVFLLSKIAERRWMWSALLVLLSGHALANNFRFGQFYLVLAILVTVGYLYWGRGHHAKGGMLLGIGAAIKYFPLVFCFEFLYRREWRILFWGMVTITALTGISVAVLGWQVHEQLVFHILGKHLEGEIQNPFSPTFQSWNSLLKRFFIFDPIRNAGPIIDSPIAFMSCLSLVYLLVFSSVIISMRQASRGYGTFGKDVQFALVCIGGLLLLPASATYHFLLLMLPAAILLKERPWNIYQKVFVVLYGAIGFIPYRIFMHFESAGILTIFAYPRLILMSGLFVAAVLIALVGPSIAPRSTLKPLDVSYDYSA